YRSAHRAEKSGDSKRAT
ncbi:Importin beta-like SAD2, partial [Hirschfeldia incana]